MRHVFLLAWRYVAFNKLKTVVLVACISITLFLPLAVSLLIRHYNHELMLRARTTPLILGARGNRFDLVLKTLYFRQGKTDTVPMSEARAVDKSGLAETIPVHAMFTAREYPVVGTDPDYFEFRGLHLEEGRLPGMLGEAVLGSGIAETLGLSPGDTILSDQSSLYNIAITGPLKMHVVGVLASGGSPDDFAVFVDVKTAWVIEGLGHGHMDVVDQDDPRYVLERTRANVAATAAVPEYTEITPENIGSFHFHGDVDSFPLTSVIVLPADEKSAVILKARYNASPTSQMLVPVEVVKELMGFVFRVKRFFDANFALVALSTLLFLILVVLLSLRLRARERDTMHKIGCSRAIVFWMQACELFIVVVVSLMLTGVLSVALLFLAPRLFTLV